MAEKRRVFGLCPLIPDALSGSFRAEGRLADPIHPHEARVAFDAMLQDRLLDDEAVRSQAAAWANEHLRQAIAGLTGLRGHTLNEIFREIREEMQRRGEALALFVEDVSTLSVLDEELVNALQPLNDPALCPLVSVLGMTLPAFDRLPDNLKGRLDRVLDLSGNSSLRLDDDGIEAADRFVARYLNGLRTGERDVSVLSSDVRSHGDQQHSACSDCPQKVRCFDAFGSVGFGTAEVGLYPLAPGAAGRLLEGLRSETGLKTPRTLLQHVVLPLLKGMASGFRGGTVNLSVQPRPPRDLAAQQDLMLASWSGDQKGRTSYLLYYWTGHDRLADGAPRLQSMLPWFGLAAGFLTGKYRTREDLQRFDRGSSIERFFDKGLMVLPVLDAVAGETGASHGAIALAWLMRQPGIAAPIASASKPEQLDVQFEALKLELTQDQLDRLTAAGR